MLFSTRIGRVKIFVVICCIMEIETEGSIASEPSNSKILKHFLSCLSKSEHVHMLKYSNEAKKEIEIKFINKKNPIWTKKDISLFKAMDDLSSKPRKRANYDEDCKVRFKANLIKWCSTGFLKYVGKRKEKPSVTIVTYKILRYPGDKPAKAKSKRNGKNHVNMDKTVVNMIGEIGNTGTFNGNICSSIDDSDSFIQLKDVVHTTYSNNLEEIGNPGDFNGNVCPSIDNSDNFIQLKDVVNTTYNVEEVGNSEPFNGNICPSIDNSDNFRQLTDVVYTTYNIEEIRNPGTFNGNICSSIDNSDNFRQLRDVVYTTCNNNCSKRVDGFDEKMIVLKNPVLSSAWKKEEKDNAYIMQHSPSFLLPKDDWMEDFSAFS